MEEHLKRQAERCLLSSKNAPSTYKSLIDTDNKYLPMKDRVLVQTRNKIKIHMILLIHAKRHSLFQLKDYLYNCISITLQSKLNQSIACVHHYNKEKNKKRFEHSVRKFIHDIRKTSYIYHGFLTSDQLLGRSSSVYDTFINTIPISNGYFGFTIGMYAAKDNAYRVDNYSKMDLSEEEQKLFIGRVVRPQEFTFYVKINKLTSPRDNLKHSNITRMIYSILSECVEKDINAEYDDTVEEYFAHTIEHRKPKHHSYDASIINVKDLDASNKKIIPLTVCLVRCMPRHHFFGKCAFLDAWANSSIMNTFASYINKDISTTHYPFPVKYGSISLYRILFEIYTLGYKQIIAEVKYHYDPKNIMKPISREEKDQMKALKEKYENIGFEYIGSVEIVTYDYMSFERKGIVFTSERLKSGEDVKEMLFTSDQLDTQKYVEREDMLLMRLVLDEDFIVNSCVPNLIGGEAEGITEEAVIRFLNQ